MARHLKKVIFDLETSGKIIRASFTFLAFFVVLTFIIMALVSLYCKSLRRMIHELVSTPFLNLLMIFSVLDVSISGSVCYKWLV